MRETHGGSSRDVEVRAQSCEGRSSPAKFSGREKIKEDINFRKKSYKMRQYKEINFHEKTAGFRAETPCDLRELRTILRGKG